ncbi:MAG TPA: hypothetical protein VMW11_07275 [Candidatus Dormibacteraeota bacterium]|nr:hypothetical protein [Candidatus Dormibacteraeota bacterium]
MSTPLADRLVSDYLQRLDAALAGVSPDRRDEIVGEIRSHIQEQRGALPDETDADVYNLLERVGEPYALAAAARSESSAPLEPVSARSRVGAVEILALVLTPLIWPVGVILLWTSSAWNTRDKLIATLVPPGGYLGLLVAFSILEFAAFSSVTVSSCGGSITDSHGNVINQACTGPAPPPGWEQALITIAAVGVAVILLLLPVLVGIYMARRLARRES